MSVTCLVSKLAYRSNVQFKMATSTIRTDFGTFIGKKGDGVVQFLGIKYAELEDQLSGPRIYRSYGKDVVDATSFG